MADLKLDILVVPTYNLNLLNITDASIYPDPLNVISPTIEITVPGFTPVFLPFTIQEPNVFNSVNLGLSEPGEYLPLPDGNERNHPHPGRGNVSSFKVNQRRS
jgi:hypothetical protein